MHIYRRNAVIFIARVIINTFICVTARGINGNFIAVLSHPARAARLSHRTENMEKLIYARLFSVFRNAVQPEKAALTKRDCEDRSPGSPKAPIPRL